MFRQLGNRQMAESQCDESTDGEKPRRLTPEERQAIEDGDLTEDEIRGGVFCQNRKT
jgi:hypothetical protein